MSKDFPQMATTSYRYDVDFTSGSSGSCNGDDLFFDDSVEISSSGDQVTIDFHNEAELPAWFALRFDKQNKLHWIKYPYEPDNRRAVPSTEEHYSYVIDALQCAVSLEKDAAKRAVLQQVLALVRAAHSVHTDPKPDFSI